MNWCSKAVICAQRSTLLKKFFKSCYFSTQKNLNVKFEKKNSMMSYKGQSRFSTYKNQQKLLKTYEKIKEKQGKGEEKREITEVEENSPKYQIPYSNTPRIECQGCSVTLQSKDNKKYGYINQKILKEALEENAKQLQGKYGDKVKNRESQILDFMHEVEKQSGVKIFNEKNNKIQNLDNLDVLMRLEDKIDKYEESEQLLHRSKNTRKQILCFRCFSLKHHNRLPEEYDNNQGFTTDSTEFILNKMLNRHKSTKDGVEYLFLIDAFDVLGTFQKWLFKRMLSEGLQISIIVNKIDVINKQYLNQNAIRHSVRERLKSYLTQVYEDQREVQKKMEEIQLFFISCNSKDGIKKLKDHIEGHSRGLQLVGFPNTGKTTLLNILSRIKKSTSKVPGTTVKISEHQYNNSKRKVYDMPGLFSENLLYNLIEKPSLKSILTWHKRIAPGLLTGQAFIYGGKIQIPDTRIIIFGQGGACQSSNRWFIDNYRQFWKGLPNTQLLNIKKYQFDIEFKDGKADDLEIAGYGFIGFRLCVPNVKKTSRKLRLYLPEKVQFSFRPTILSVNDAIFHNKSALTKKFMLERLTLKEHGSQVKDKAKGPKQSIDESKNQEEKNEEAEFNEEDEEQRSEGSSVHVEKRQETPTI